MELHENLYALGLRLGREVFDDPDSFRGALDDFLDEDSATTGDINLLVDAVRLRAFASMTSMLDSGAQVTAAIEEAGSRLARDRGSADVAGAQWACAVLGFAIGKVSDAEVRRYRTQHAGPPQQTAPHQTGQPLPPTQFPAQQPPPTAQPPAQAQQPPVPPTQYPAAQPTAFAQSGGAPTPPGAVPPPTSWPGGGGPTPPKQRKTWPILVAVVAVLAVVAGGIIALVVTGGDDDGDKADPKQPESSETVEEVDVDLASIRERYSGLGGDVTAGLDDECEAGEPGEGATEVVTCPFANGTLELTTYETQEALRTAREANTGTDPGNRYSATDAGVLYSINSGSAVAEQETSSLYWDSNEGLQSGKYAASSDTVTVDQLVEVFETTNPVVAWPTEPEDEGMIALAEEFVNLEDCNRIDTIQAGEIEETICTATDEVTIFMGVFRTKADFKNYRREALQQGADQGNPLRNWNFGGGVREGAAAEYLNSSGSAVRYWDKPECKCYMEASRNDDDLDALEDWWVNA